MRLFFNEYYKRKPYRLWEKDGEIFCMEKGGEYDYEFISIDEHEQELAKLKEENEKLKSLVDDFILDCERCDRYFQSSSSRNQFKRRLMNKKKEVLGE